MARKCIRGYTKVSLIGEGYFGQVWLVEKGGKFYAMKICDVEDTDNYNEIKFLKSISHPNIIKMIEYFEKNDKLYIITELYGTCVAKLKLSPNLVKRVYYDMKKAITYLGENHILHNDIHTENILNKKISKKTRRIIELYCLEKQINVPEFNDKNEFILIDFNMAMITGEDCEYGYFFSNYMSPETIYSEKKEKQSDYWMLGATLYELLNGKRLFTAKDYEAQAKQIRKVLPGMTYYGEEPYLKKRRNIFKGLDFELKVILKNLFKINPEYRRML